MNLLDTNALGLDLFCLAVRVSVVALAALALAAWCGRRNARAGVEIGAWGMLLVLLLSVAAVVPWPDFGVGQRADASTIVKLDVDARDQVVSVETTEGDSSGLDLFAWLSAFRGSLSAESASHWGWRCAAFFYAVCLVVAGSRLLWSFLLLERLRRNSRPISDHALLEEMQALCAALELRSSIELRETDEPGLAATFGWLRPVLLLPAEWRAWPDDERRAVLAHELAHVRHRDFLWGLLGNLCRALHWYHPLVHRLAAQLRWRQEVAADDLAAAATGGRTAYKFALVRLALRMPARKPAEALLSPAMTGGAFLRRIRMLHGTQNRRPLSAAWRGLFVALLAGAALLVGAWRGPAHPPRAQTEGAGEREATPVPYEIGYIVPDAKGLFAARPSEWVRQPGMERFQKMVEEVVREVKKQGIDLPDVVRLENMEQIVANQHITSKGDGTPGSRSVMFGTSTMLVRFHKDVDGKALLRPFLEEMKETKHGDTTILHLGTVPVLGPLPVSLFQPDKRTLVFVIDKNENAPAKLLDGAAQARKRHWGSGWKQVEHGPFAVVLDNSDAYYAKTFANDHKDIPEIETILDHARFLTVGIELGDDRPVRFVLDAQTPEKTQILEKAAQQLVARAAAKVKEGPMADEEKVWFKLAKELLETGRFQRDGARLEWTGKSSVRLRDLVNDGGFLTGVSVERRP
ncbi:MAG: M56 family metallopeptidase [Gemmataceae bacterium]|nr:M56 family metallopeptidase [Gemmataceae bacterium]MCI0739331.1 M56 family metallopeptidase [Gemmataceae bacterium]